MVHLEGVVGIIQALQRRSLRIVKGLQREYIGEGKSKLKLLGYSGSSHQHGVLNPKTYTKAYSLVP